MDVTRVEDRSFGDRGNEETTTSVVSESPHKSDSINLQVVTVLHIGSPSKLVVSRSCAAIEEAILSRIEAQMTEEWMQAPIFGFGFMNSATSSLPQPGMHVMVKSEDWKGLRRGLILSFHNFAIKEYHVYLYDYNIHQMINVCNIAALKKEFETALLPRMFLIQIIDAYPLNYTGNGQLIWGEKAIHFVEKWVNSSRCIGLNLSFETGLTYRVGDLYRFTGPNSVDKITLSRALKDKKLAICERKFAKYGRK